MLPPKESDSLFLAAAAAAGVSTLRADLLSVRTTAEIIHERAKFLAHFLKKQCNVKPIVAHDAIARASRFDGWMAMSARCKRLTEIGDAESSAEAREKLLESLAAAVPLLIEVERAQPPEERQIAALTAFAHEIDEELVAAPVDVLDAIAKWQHSTSWPALLARNPGASAAPLYTVKKRGLRAHFTASLAEEQLVLLVAPRIVVGDHLEAFTNWPLSTTKSDHSTWIAERLRAILAERPDFIRGYAMLGAALDNLRDPSCLDWYAKARAGVAAVMERDLGRDAMLSAQLPWEIRENRWALDVGRLEAWALARYNANYGGAVALTIGLKAFDPADFGGVMRDQVAFACANGSWTFMFGVKEHDLSSVFMSGLFRMVRAVAHGAGHLEPKGLAQVLRAWVTTDWTEDVLTKPIEELDAIDRPTRIGACVKLVRETRAAEFTAVMDMIAAEPGLLDGVKRLVKLGRLTRVSNIASLVSGEDVSTQKAWGLECAKFIAAMTGLPESEV